MPSPGPSSPWPQGRATAAARTSSPADRSALLRARPWSSGSALAGIDHHDADAACRGLVRTLGEGGWLNYLLPAALGGPRDKVDVRSLCIARDLLARDYLDGRLFPGAAPAGGLLMIAGWIGVGVAGFLGQSR